MSKRTKITIETESLLILRGRRSPRAWCPQCGVEGEMIVLGDLGVISNLTPSDVEAWFECEAIHRSRSEDGTELICLNSLLKRSTKAKTA
jgi:hypothetical protein